MTTRSITWRQGETLDVTVPTDIDLTGRDLVLRVRKRSGDEDIMIDMSSDGPPEARITAVAGGYRVQLGAEEGSAVQTRGLDARWVYGAKAIDSTDPEIADWMDYGEWIVVADRARAGDQVAPTPAGDLRYLQAAQIVAGTGVTITQSGAGAGLTLTFTAAGGAGVWGSITGTLSAQTDLQSALDGKADVSHTQDFSTITGVATHKLLGRHTTGAGAAELVGLDGFLEFHGANLRAMVGTTAQTLCVGNDPRLSDARTPTGTAGGDLSWTYPNPTVSQARGLRESGGTTLTIGAVADGEYLRRVGTALVGATPAGGSASNTRWVGAGEWIPRVTNGAGIDGEEFGTNRQNLDYLAFDPGTAEFAQVWLAWPGAFTTFTATFYWTSASGSGSVVWQALARGYADDDAIDQAFGTAQSVTDTLLAANDVHQSAATAAITPAGSVAAGRLVCFDISRDATNGSDTLAVDARLIGVRLEFAA